MLCNTVVRQELLCLKKIDSFIEGDRQEEEESDVIVRLRCRPTLYRLARGGTWFSTKKLRIVLL
jgi:hypothetical protein